MQVQLALNGRVGETAAGPDHRERGQLMRDLLGAQAQVLDSPVTHDERIGDQLLERTRRVPDGVEDGSYSSLLSSLPSALRGSCAANSTRFGTL